MKKRELYKRTLKELWLLSKETLIWTLLDAVFKNSLSFIGLFYMGKMLTLLSIGAYSDVYSLIGQYLVLFVFVQVMTILLTPIKDQSYTFSMRKIISRPNEKMTHLNFHYADKAEIQERLFKIKRDQQTNPSSLYQIFHASMMTMDHFIRFIFSFILLIPLFSSNPTPSGETAWVNGMGINFVLLLVALIGTLCHLFYSYRTMNKVNESTQEITKINNIYYYLYHQLMSTESGKEIRLYNNQNYIGKVMAQSQAWLEKFFSDMYAKTNRGIISSTIVTQLINWMAYLLVGLRVILGGLPIGMVIQLTGALTELMQSLEKLLNFVVIFSNMEPMESYFMFMDLSDDQAKGSIPTEKRLDNQYQLAVESVDFAYPGSSKNVLEDLSIEFEIGKRYAIVGENGSGKTTFIKLLMRLYEPTNGKILLNTINADKYAIKEFYQLFSVVFQDFKLLGFNFAENIAVGPSFDKEKIEDMMVEVGINDFVQQLDQGMYTSIGTEYDKKGVEISGGQAQKIAIARALYKDAPIAILDEPTAALDPQAEFEIYQKFSQLVKGKTAFYISHRLSSCRFCDEILVFDKGRIIQKGTHDALVNQSGKYQELWKAQAQYYQ